jgi:hypothetical protein
MPNWKEFLRKWCVLIENSSRNLPGWTAEHHKPLSIYLACVSADIRTEYLPETSLQHYHFISRNVTILCRQNRTFSEWCLWEQFEHFNLLAVWYVLTVIQQLLQPIERNWLIAHRSYPCYIKTCDHSYTNKWLTQWKRLQQALDGGRMGK